MRTYMWLALAVALGGCALEAAPLQESTQRPMADPPAIPVPDDIVGAGTTAMVAQRPSCAPFLLQGRYRDVVDGWRAQAALGLRRMADESAATRIPTSEGDALRQLSASEFFIDTIPVPQVALGRFALARTVTDTNATKTNWTPGVIPAGFRFHKISSPTAQPPIEAADYTSIEPTVVDSSTGNVDVSLGGGQFSHTQTVLVRVQATRPGPHANIPPFTIGAGQIIQTGILSLTDTAFDTSFQLSTTSISDAAGGSLGFTDPNVRRLARAGAAGQFGPTTTALELGLLQSGFVKHWTLIEDTTSGTTHVSVADESWAWSNSMVLATFQFLQGTGGNDGSAYIGFGCQADILQPSILNVLVSVKATVVLATTQAMLDTTDISANVRAALQNYFDNRPDFWALKINGVAATIASADRRILAVLPSPAPQVIRVQDQVALPDTVGAPSLANLPNHYWLNASGVSLTFVAPQ